MMEFVVAAKMEFGVAAMVEFGDVAVGSGMGTLEGKPSKATKCMERKGTGSCLLVGLLEEE